MQEKGLGLQLCSRVSPGISSDGGGGGAVGSVRELWVVFLF